MEQNKDIFPDKNSFPDNPYNQYYQEYLKDPEKEKNKISKPKQIGSMVLCGVFYMLKALKRIKRSIWDS